MRSTGWIVAAAVVGLIGWGGDAQAGCNGCNRNAAVGNLGADACCSTPGYGLVPGCCDDSRHCCDNAWEGYCEHRARVEAFWARVGTPNAYARSRPCRQGAVCESAECSTCETPSKPSVSPTPAPPATAPADVPEPPAAPSKAAKRPTKSWLRW